MPRRSTCAVFLALVLAAVAALVPSAIASDDASDAGWSPVAMVGVSPSKASGMGATAAHCVPDTGGVHFAVMMETCQVSEVLEDVGPATFSESSDLASYPVALRAVPQTVTPVRASVAVIGYGRDEQGVHSCEIREVRATPQPLVQCEAALDASYQDPDAWGCIETDGLCAGWSGAPVIVDGHPVGVVSHGQGCGAGVTAFARFQVSASEIATSPP